MNFPKILVGTMACGEGDYEKCMHAIMSQKEVQIEHVLIENMLEVDAHVSLWENFEKRKSSFDLIVKVDADTVLIRPTILKEIYEFMSSNSRITGMQIYIHDYFTDGLIGGLNCFKPCVTFSTPESSLYCDRVDSGHDIVIKGNEVPSHLTPAARHCHYANNRQAFHFGLHRSLKGQVDTIEKVRDAWLAHRDDLRAYVLLGVMASSEFEDHKGFSYNQSKFIESFEMVKDNFDDLVGDL